MTEKPSDLFERAKASSVEWNGLVVYSMYECAPATALSSFRIAFEDPNPTRPEGLRLKIRGGTLRIHNRNFDDIVLWSDSAPPVVTGELQPHRNKAAVLRIWNCWRDAAGTVQAWIGNAGMLVDETSNGIIVRCSDGFDEARFDDLVASIEITFGSS